MFGICKRSDIFSPFYQFTPMFKVRNILFIALIAAAFFTNPTEKAFKTEIEDQLIKEMKLDEEQNIVGEMLSSKLVESLLWAVVRVDYQDYKLCSTFELKAGARQMKFLGIFGQIIPISGKGKLTDIDLK
jgi:hypothetical protein